MNRPVPKQKFFIAALFFAGWVFSSFAAAPADNACVDCHEKKVSVQYARHNFKDWRRSIHAAKGVGCEACHGGNPHTTDPVKAHQGILPSGDKASPLYFQNVAQTCGRCHKAEFTAFQKSAHYKTLLRTGKGPNCLTCHGAMATTVMKYGEMEATCSLCHGKPTQAARALSLMNALNRSLDLYRKRVSQKWGTVIPEEESARLTQYLQRYHQIQQMWHSFDMGRVTDMSEALIRDLTRKP